MADNFPESFADPVYDKADAGTEQKLGLPVGAVAAIRTAGERSNASATNKFGTASPYQFIPATRKAILDKYGIDVLLSPENASEGAGLLLKESLKRNDGDLETAVREYHGGTDRENWGKVNDAYAKRVMAAQGGSKAKALSSGFAQFMADNPAVPENHGAPAATPEAPKPSGELSSGFGQWLAANPDSGKDAPAPKPLGFLEGVKESITGDLRRTPETEAAPDWAGMPEMNSFSIAGAKTGLGTLLAQPKEAVQIIQSNFPGVKARQDDHGNYFLQSSIDGKEYAIKPGFRASDVPRALAGVAAFTPAGRATTLGGAALASGATQAVIEGSQAATGGTFDPGEVGTATVLGGVVPGVVRAVQAAKAPLGRVLDRVRGIEPPAPLPVPDGIPVPPPAPPVPANPAAPLESADLADAARTAANGGMGSKNATQVLAEQAAPDAKVVDAAKRLGIEDYLQPDHVTTNQAYRELAQAVKSIPGSQARAAEMTGLEAVAKRADDLVEQIGGTHDTSTLSANVKGNLQATQATLEKQAEDLYARVKAAIPPKTEAAANSTLEYLKNHADELGGAGRLLPTEKKLLGALAGEDGPLTYAFLDQTRKQIGQAMRKASGPFADSESGTLKRLYGTLSEDQSAIANSAGVGDLYSAAKASVAVRKGIEDDLSALFGKNLDQSLVGKLSGSVKPLAAGDTARFVKLIQSIPEDMRQQVVASGLDTAFGIGAKRGEISFTSYASWYEGLLKNKQAYNAIMSNLPQQARKQLSDLYRVSSSISKASKERIVTGRINAVTDQLKGPDNLVARLYDSAKRSSMGAIVGTAAAPIVGPGAAAAIASTLTKGAKPSAIKAVDALITSSEFINLAKQGAQPPRRALLRLVHSDSFKRYAKEVGQARDPEAAEKWISQAMQNNNNQSR